MEISFRGWKREVRTHTHVAIPVQRHNNNYKAGKKGEPLKWHSGTQVFAKISNLALNGNFLVEMQFEQSELQSWLINFIKNDPESAAPLISKLQGEVMLALSKKAKEDAMNEIQEQSKT